MTEYNVRSERAEEFIHDGEIRATLEYAREHRADKALIEEILTKAEQGNGITHREAAVLIEVEDKDIEERMYAIARRLKERIYGNRIVMFAPLYLSNHCVNGCVYCPYHAQNRHIPRRKLTQEEIRREVIALQDMGHKRLAL
ncbi:MAG: [FeFe] hydrogenase H-cluster radical SAM maturase HydG, partial [Alistipes sp.]|nr:[FeFe] hydrogenase H-cluster radical SAM maturase HydG [Alistipes sp.]